MSLNILVNTYVCTVFIIYIYIDGFRYTHFPYLLGSYFGAPASSKLSGPIRQWPSVPPAGAVSFKQRWVWVSPPKGCIKPAVFDGMINDPPYQLVSRISEPSTVFRQKCFTRLCNVRTPMKCGNCHFFKWAL